MTPLKLYEKVYKFKTKHKEGFTSSEIEQLLDELGVTDKDRYAELLGVNTCMIIEEQVITFKNDIYYAMKRYFNFYTSPLEWD